MERCNLLERPLTRVLERALALVRALAFEKALALEKALQGTASTRMTQLAQRLRLDLTDSLARHIEVLSDFFESAIRALANSETHPKDASLAWSEGRE